MGRKGGEMGQNKHLAIVTGSETETEVKYKDHEKEKKCWTRGRNTL